jgi:hypothetical protein
MRHAGFARRKFGVGVIKVPAADAVRAALRDALRRGFDILGKMLLLSKARDVAL